MKVGINGQKINAVSAGLSRGKLRLIFMLKAVRLLTNKYKLEYGKSLIIFLSVGNFNTKHQ